MSPLLLSTIGRSAFLIIAIAGMLLIAHRRGFLFSGYLGFQLPKPWPAFGFLCLWVVLIIVEEWISQSSGVFAAKPWPEYSFLVVGLRILTMGVLGPVAEEIAFRGLLFGRRSRTRLGAYGAVVVCAVIWSVLHLQYSFLVMGFIVVDGLTLGLARHFSNSLWVPITMHIAGNLFSITQSLNA